MNETNAGTAPVNLLAETGSVLSHLQEVEAWIAGSGLDPMLVHLVKLRVSQLNGCAHCVKMHAADLRAAGEVDARLDHLAAWRFAKEFSDAEKAALAWVEALSDLDATQSHGAGRAALRAYYSEREIAALIVVTSMINLWNRLQISNH